MYSKIQPKMDMTRTMTLTTSQTLGVYGWIYFSQSFIYYALLVR